MKKLLAVLLAAVMAVSLVSCGSTTSTASADIKSPEDFSGKKVSVQTGTTAADALLEMQESGTDVNIMPYEQITQCFEDLKLGRVDAVYVDSVVAAYYLAGEDSQYQVVWKSDEGEPMGICLSKEKAELGEQIEAAIDTLYYNGKISEIAEKHFGTDVTEGVREVTEEPVIDKSKVKTITEGKLLVGAEMGYPPMEYTDDTGLEYIGFDIDMGKEIGALLGVEVEFINTSFDGIFEGLGKNQYDCAISGISILPERQEKYFMGEPYLSNQVVIVTKK